MSKLLDPEFGQITLRRSRLARAVRLKLDTSGTISMSMPVRTPLYIAKQLLNESRSHLRQLLTDIQTRRPSYEEGHLIGKTHRLGFETADTYGHQIRENQLIVRRPLTVQQASLERAILDGIHTALRVQAKAYLPRRLRYFAELYGFSYKKVRFGIAGTRWGSCSSQGTISLNIWLMQLPFELIDYVLLHELCHTKHMNHSQTFWKLLQEYCPKYKLLRQQLRTYHPHP